MFYQNLFINKLLQKLDQKNDSHVLKNAIHRKPNKFLNIL